MITFYVGRLDAERLRQVWEITEVSELLAFQILTELGFAADEAGLIPLTVVRQRAIIWLKRNLGKQGNINRLIYDIGRAADNRKATHMYWGDGETSKVTGLSLGDRRG